MAEKTPESGIDNVVAQETVAEGGDMEEKISQQDEFLRNVLDSLPHPLYVIDINDYTIKIANSAARAGNVSQNITCHALSRASKKPCSGREHICPLEQVKKTRKPVVVEHTYQGKDGSIRNIEVHGYPVFDRQGNLIQMMEYCLDITERNQAIQRQKLAIQVLELLNQSGKKIDTICDILLLIKRFTKFEAVGIRLREGEDFPYYEVKGFPSDFVEAGRYLCARNQDGKTIRDLDGNAVLECMCGNVISGRTNPSLPFFTKGGSFWTNRTTGLLASTTEEDRRARTRNRCNAQGYESVALIPLRSGNEVIGLLQLNDSRKNMFTPEMIAFFEGIGDSIGIALDRRKAEEILSRDKESIEKLVNEKTKELLKAQKELEKAKRLSDIGTLAATVAHELRNPLGVIQIASYNIRRKRRNPSLDKHVSNIERKIFESSQIINNLLNYSRIKMPHYENVNLYDILDECIISARKRFHKEKVSVDKRFESLKNKVIEADPLQIREVFNNILNNAYQSLAGGKGKIEIRGRIDGKGSIRVSFKDNGIGIDKEDLERVFDPFFTRKSRGTGLGLAICKELVRLHGGKINMESAQSKGTTVTVSLPIGG